MTQTIIFSNYFNNGIKKRSVMLITFSLEFFYNFLTGSKSASNSAFFDTHFKISWNIIFAVILALFANFEAKRAQNGPKNEKSFFQTWIRINYIFRFWFRISKLLNRFTLLHISSSQGWFSRLHIIMARFLQRGETVRTCSHIWRKYSSWITLFSIHSKIPSKQCRIRFISVEWWRQALDCSDTRKP
jgi:hypothetical protein